jgi:hypothetical protein
MMQLSIQLMSIHLKMFVLISGVAATLTLNGRKAISMCCKGVKACTTRKRKAAQLNF